MKQYMVLKRFTLNNKTFIKDRIFSSGSVRRDVMKRLVAGGYIKAIATMDVEYEEPAAYEGVENFLTPTEVNKLKLDDLMKYAKHIGMEDLDSKIKITDLRNLINDFIGENSEYDDNLDDDNQSQEGNGNA